MESTLDFDDVVLIEAMDLNSGARRIGALAPQFRLHLVHDRAEAEHVGDIDDEADGVPQRRTFGFRDQLHVEENLANSGFVAGSQSVGGRINAAHAGDEQEITGSGREVPGAGRLYGSSWPERLDPVGDVCCAKAGQQSTQTIAIQWRYDRACYLSHGLLTLRSGGNHRVGADTSRASAGLEGKIRAR